MRWRVGFLLIALGAPALRADSDPAQAALRRFLDGLRQSNAVATGPVQVVPLYRPDLLPPPDGQPSEGPFWIPQVLRAEEVTQDGTFVRVSNPGAVSILLPPGAVVGDGKREVVTLTGAVIPCEYTVLLPAREIAGGFSVQKGRVVSLLPPRAAGRYLFRGTPKALEETQLFWNKMSGSRLLGPLGKDSAVKSARLRLDVLWSALAPHVRRRTVGFAVVLEGKVEGLHLFATPRLLEQALPLLFDTIAVNQAEIEHRARLAAGKKPLWLSPPGLARSRVGAFLKDLRKSPARLSESYGAGFELLLTDPARRVAGQVLLDAGHRGLYGCFYEVPVTAAPGGAPGAPRPGGPGVGGGGGPPPPGPAETSPNQVDRKARPTIAEQRQRDRKPPGGVKPPNRLGGNAGGGGARNGGGSRGGSGSQGGGGGAFGARDG